MTQLHSLVTIVPAASKDDARAFIKALDDYEIGLGVPLSANGQEPATHYGSHAWVTPEHATKVSGEKSPRLSKRYRQEEIDKMRNPEISRERDPRGRGYARKQINDVRGKMIGSLDRNGLTAKAHFEAVLQVQELQIIAVKLL